MTATERAPLLPKIAGDAPRQNLILLYIGVWSLVFISTVDGTIVATLISTIGSSMESMQLSSWIGTAYMLSFCAFTPLYGRLANIFGRRTSVLFAGTIFGVGTVLCGFARNMTQLIAFRALAGVGGGMTVVGSVVISDSVPLTSRALHQGYANLVFSFGSAVGPPLGGWLGEAIGWRAAFIVQGPFVFFALFLLYREIREPAFILTADRSTFSAKLKRIDYLGSASLVLGLLCFLVGMYFQTTAGYGWENPRVWGCLLASALVACAFIVIENHFAAEPVMPLRMLKRRTPGFANLYYFLLSVYNFSTIYNVPLYFIAARIRSSTDAGVHFIPFSATLAFGSAFTAWYMNKTGRYWWIQVFACLAVVVTSVWLACWDADTPEWMLYTTLVPFGFGFIALSTTGIVALISSVPKDEIPVATGGYFLSRVMGQVIGVSLPAALTQELLARNLRARIVGAGAAETIAKILASTEYIHTLPPDLQQKAAASWMGALHVVFCCQIVLAVLMLLSVLPIEENELPGRVADADADATTRRAGTPTP